MCPWEFSVRVSVLRKLEVVVSNNGEVERYGREKEESVEERHKRVESCNKQWNSFNLTDSEFLI